MLWAQAFPEFLVRHHVVMLGTPMRIYSVPTIALERVFTLRADTGPLRWNILFATTAGA